MEKSDTFRLYAKSANDRYVLPAWHNYRYHKNRLPSQDDPKYNSRKIIGVDRNFNFRMNFWGWDQYRALTNHLNNACDIYLKHALSDELRR